MATTFAAVMIVMPVAMMFLTMAFATVVFVVFVTMAFVFHFSHPKITGT